MMSLGLGLVLSVFFAVKSFVNYKMPKMLNVLGLLIVVFGIYGILLQLSGSQGSMKSTGFEFTGIRYIHGSFSSLTPIIAFFYLTKKGFISKRTLQIWFFFFLIIATLRFFSYESARILNSKFNIDEVTNNLSYDFLALLPLVLLFKEKPTIQYGSLIYIMFFILYGMKRGAILIAMICFLILFWKLLNDRSKKTKIATIVFGTVVVIAMFYFFNQLMRTSDYFNQRIASTIEGNTSGRDFYYSTLLLYFLNLQSPLKFLFGGGAYYTFKLLGNVAHNDWLEILINNGIVLAFVYLIYWCCFLREVKRAKKTDYLLSLLLLFVIGLLKSFFSMSYSSTPLYSSLYLGYCLASMNKVHYENTIS